MAWTCSNWVTLPRGTTQRVDQLRLHVQEVSDKVTASVQSAGTSVETSVLNDYLTTLHAKLEREEQASGLSGTYGGGQTGADFRR